MNCDAHVKSSIEYAMSKTTGWGFCWWSDPTINNLINVGVKEGWLVRCSTTQVHWTDAAMGEF